MKKTLVIHPFLFAIYPILFIFANNLGYHPLSVVVVPITIAICFTSLSWYLLNILLKKKEKAGLVVSLFLVLFTTRFEVMNPVVLRSPLILTNFVSNSP